MNFKYFFLFFTLFSKIIVAQVIEEISKPYLLDSVVVEDFSPTIIFPTNIEYLDENILNNYINPTSLEDIFQSQPGIIVNNRFNFAQGDKIQIRGIGSRARFGVRGIKIMLDGIPLTFTDGQSQLNNLDILNLQSIEILKGPSSVLFGNSLGGTILLKSKLQSNSEINVSPQIVLGSYGYSKYGFSSNGSLLNTDYSINISRNQSKGFRDHSDARFYNLNLLTKTKISESIILSFTANYFNAPYLLNPSTLNKSDAINNPTKVRDTILKIASGKNVNQFQSGINVAIRISNKSKFNASLYGASRSLLNSIPGRIIELERLFGGTNIQYESRFKLLNIHFQGIVGFNYEGQFDKRKEYINNGIDENIKINPSTIFDKIKYSYKLINQNEDVENYAIYSHLSFKPINNLNIIAGVRYDDYNFSVKDDFNNASSKIPLENISTTIGFKAQVFEDVNLYGNYSNGFQTPTTNELSNNPFDAGGFNQNLKPEKINNYEIGTKVWWSQIGFVSSMSLYMMDISNMLIPYQNINEETFYRNAGEANNTGIEITFNYILSNDVFINLSYNYSDFRFGDYKVDNESKIVQLKNNFLPGVPQNKVSASLSGNITERLMGRISYNWTDKYFTNDFNGSLSEEDHSEYINDSYSKLTLSATYDINLYEINFSCNARIDNLLNVRYNDSIVPNAFGKNFFEPAAGRTFFFGFTLKI